MGTKKENKLKKQCAARYRSLSLVAIIAGHTPENNLSSHYFTNTQILATCTPLEILHTHYVPPFSALRAVLVVLIAHTLHVGGGLEHHCVLCGVSVFAQNHPAGAQLAHQHVEADSGGGAHDELAVRQGRDDAADVLLFKTYERKENDVLAFRGK